MRNNAGLLLLNLDTLVAFPTKPAKDGGLVLLRT